ncbi:hypothetical protein OG394_05455 [Kribbella sp. NBC_01245]|uniref:hypothetical protein n=1 Tax=Kribbella sp. NBC_01245 TaxID=2903578 RepID=UPI002E2C4564|nr:hypothetical protein [Kribbella sp. NBC_01245]
MTDSPSHTVKSSLERSWRQIGPVGTASRLALGGYLVWTLVDSPFPQGVSPWSIGLGVLVLPALFTGWQWLRARRRPAPLAATGPLATAINFAGFLALYFTPVYAPPLAWTQDAAVLFYGVAMLLAAIRGYAGCEVLAISNWLLRRDDHIGCLVFSPIDQLERRWMPAAALAQPRSCWKRR